MAQLIFVFIAKIAIAAICIAVVFVITWITYKTLRTKMATYLRLFRKYVLTKASIFIIRDNNIGYADVIFNMFVSFYERELKDIEKWELPSEFFPKGKAELSEMYKWIKKTRKENYIELQNISFDDALQSFRYWGASYKVFKSRIINGELCIEPTDECSANNIGSMFKLKLMKAENDLYDLDTAKAAWIIERRRFFNI